MNLDLVNGIFEIIQTIIEATKQLREAYIQGDINTFNAISMDIWDGLTAIRGVALQQEPEESRMRLADASFCALESLKDIKMLVLTNPGKVEWKIRCELLTIVETMGIQLMYWGIVEQSPEKKEDFFAFLTTTGLFGEIEQSEDRRYEYDLTIWVTAYNKLDYTKKCVQSILDNWPSGIKTELVLYNHGSSDGTRQYFESIPQANVFNVAINKAVNHMAARGIGGKYVLFVSNDVVIGKNAIDNLYRGISGHDDIGWMVPTTPNVSNLQSIELTYSDDDSFNAVTEQNNIYDEKRHEVRLRLCNPINIARSDIWNKGFLEEYESIMCCKDVNSFPDDKYSLWARRHGYKSILAKDAYCHHFGSVTLKDEIGRQAEKQLQFYNEGRLNFEKEYGIDPWGTGFCYDFDLFEMWDIPLVEYASVLGINCGLGSNSLKVKEVLREKGALDVKLVNYVQESKYLIDLKGISDEAYCFERLEEILNGKDKAKYNYIVVDDFIDGIDMESIIVEFLKIGLDYDQLAVKRRDNTWAIYKKG